MAVRPAKVRGPRIRPVKSRLKKTRRIQSVGPKRASTPTLKAFRRS